MVAIQKYPKHKNRGKTNKKMVKQVRNQVRITCWSKTDLNAKTFQMTGRHGPEWAKVMSRTTVDLEKGEIVEDIAITRNMHKKFLTRPLPTGVSNIMTIFRYKMNKKEHMNRLMSQWRFQETDLGSTMMTQYHVSKGLKIFGDKGIKAVSQAMCAPQ